MAPLLPVTFSFRLLLVYILAGFAILLFILYVLFQARFIIEGPQIVLTSEHAQVSTERIVHIEGSARNITSMTLNGRKIYTDKYGNFKEALVLENGYTIATLQAEDRYGRKTDLIETFVFVGSTTPISN
jgi:hypothetical protein